MQAIQFCTVFLLFNLSISMKVRERLLKYKSGEARCIIAMPDERLLEQTHETMISLIESFAHAALDLNCTIFVDKRGFFTKTPGPNETYDGWVGTVHRDEADFSIWLMRPDLLPGEPGKITPPIISGDIVILASLYPAEKLSYDLTKFLDLDAVVYIFMSCMIFFLVPMIYVCAENRTVQNGGHETLLYCPGGSSSVVRVCST